jgi:hypothetical protein
VCTVYGQPCRRPRVARHCQTDRRTPLYYIIIVITKIRRRVSLQWRWWRGRLNNKDDGCLFLSDEWITCLLLRHHKKKTCRSSRSCHPLFTTIYNVFRSDIFVTQKIKSTAAITIIDCVQYIIMSWNEN